MSVSDRKADTWAHFAEAVRAARDGHYGLAQQLVESVRVRFGDEAAEIQRRELWSYIGSREAA